MNKIEVMKKLKSLGSEQTRKMLVRHGVVGESYGVRYADLYKLQKQLQGDHGLAKQLWATGNHDARILAALICDPAQLTASELDAWARTVTNELTLYEVARVAARSSTARKRMEKWIEAKQEWVAATGWGVLSALAGEDHDLGDATYAAYLERIEASIHESPNRVMHMMNQTLISIGVRNAGLEKKALAAAKRIGRVNVDHGETQCKTPDAAPYIKKVVARRKKKKTVTKKSSIRKKRATV